MRGDEPWWVANDVCEALEISNPRDAISVLDEDEKGVGKIYTPGGEQEMNIISESGVFALIMRSNKPEAKKFRKWVTSEVLPAIRKTGRFNMTDAPTQRILPLIIEELKKMLHEAEEKGKPTKFINKLESALIDELLAWSEVERSKNIYRHMAETNGEFGVIPKIVK